MQRTIFYLFAAALFFGGHAASILLEQNLALDSRAGLLYVLAQAAVLALLAVVISVIYRRVFGR
jgi:NADH:ubiquinone oxidoreductase subunit H